MSRASFGRKLLGVASPGGRRARLLIFTFHRVLADPDPLLPGEPDASAFGRMAGWIADYCNVLPLADAAGRLAAGTLPPRAACITFDDGYADTETVAAPALQSLGIPATVFVAVGAVRAGIMWNDLALDGVRAGGGELDVTAAGLSQDAWQAAHGAARAAMLLNALKYRAPEVRWRLASELHAAATGGREPRRHMLDPEALKRLRTVGFDIGGHTVNHPILTQVPDAEARHEIETCRDWIAATVGAQPLCFAYPNGKRGRDFDARHVAMVRDAGFRVGVTTEWGAARRGADPQQLPRIAPWENSKGRFLARLVRTCL